MPSLVARFARVVDPPYGATITLDSSRDSILFTPTGADVDAFGAAPVGGAFLYSDESLDAWFSLPSPVTRAAKRANAHGSFGIGVTTLEAAEPKIIGRYFGMTKVDAADARARLSAMYNDGSPIVMRVTDASGEVSSRIVWVTSFDVDWTSTETFTFDMTLFAPDPRRYGALIESGEVGLGTPAGGLRWPLGTTPGLWLDWGVAGTAPTIALTNPGNTTAYPTLYVGGAGAFPGGFRLTEVDTAREVSYESPLGQGSTITINNRTRRASLDYGDVTERFTTREWFQVPSGSTRTYRLDAIGVPVGSPTYRATMMPANL